MNRGLVILLGAGGAALLAFAFFGTRRGNSITTIGNVGSTIALPFGMGSSLPSLDSIAPASTTVSGASQTAATVAAVPGAFNRYGIKTTP